MVVVVELSLGLLVVANVTELSYRLGSRTISTFATETTYLPIIWTFIAILIHLSGTLALKLEPSRRAQQRWKRNCDGTSGNGY